MIHPGLAGKYVYSLLSNPQIHKLREREKGVIDQAKQRMHPFNNFEVKCYSWGPEGGIPLFLIHGWEGHTGNFGALIEPLTQMGYHILGFDAPAHGLSSPGRTDMLAYTQFLATMFTQYNPGVVISHSFGTMNTALALRSLIDYRLDHWIMIASPHTFESRIETVRKQYQVPQKTLDKLATRFEHKSGESISALNFEHYQAFLGNIKDVLILHSLTDRVIPFRYAEQIQRSLKQSKLIALENLGHFGILWSPQLLDHLLKHLSVSDIENKS